MRQFYIVIDPTCRLDPMGYPLADITDEMVETPGEAVAQFGLSYGRLPDGAEVFPAGTDRAAAEMRVMEINERIRSN